MTSSDSLLQPRSTRKAWLWLLIAATQCQVLHGVQQRYSTAAPDNYKVFVYPPLEINNFVQCSNVHGHGGGSWNVSGEKPFERVTDCAQTQDGCRPDDKHNVDVFFVRAVTSPTFKTVPAADAKLFVVPFLCTQSGWHSACGNHGSNMRHLAAYLQRSPWFQRHGGADHFILCDREAESLLRRYEIHGKKIFHKVISANFEPNKLVSGLVGVGYSTLTSRFYSCPSGQVSTPVSHRKHLLSAVFSLHAKRKAKHISGNQLRQSLACDWRWNAPSIPPNEVVLSIPGNPKLLDDTICNTSSYSIKTHIPRPFSGPFEKCEAASLYADSRMVLSPAGDTATTDRIWNNFESETPTAILVEQLHDILRALPFPAIPWRRMFVPLEINSTHFAASLWRSSRAVPLKNLEDVQRLMHKWKHHVLWHVEGSVAHLHTIREAQAIAVQRLANEIGTQARPIQPLTGLDSMHAVLWDAPEPIRNSRRDECANGTRVSRTGGFCLPHGSKARDVAIGGNELYDTRMAHYRQVPNSSFYRLNLSGGGTAYSALTL